MNQKSFVIAAILAATALSVIATPLAYAQVMGDLERKKQQDQVIPVQPAQIKM